MTEQQITEEASGTDIAIVGMSGRFPGAGCVDELWQAIRGGRSGITRFTDEELRAAGVAEELLADPSYVKANPVLDGIELFDAGFFGVSHKEAQILDPQQRLFLEHSWEALEDAGCDPSRFDGAVGVFGGAGFSSYLTNNLVPAGMGAAMGELALGLANDKDSLTTRVAHTLGLSGPSYGVQSYCSTSLVAVCAAATSLANFECDLALAGGVAVSVPHRVGYLYQQGGIAPPDGECRAFDAAGLGSPLGNGVGVVALRRLEDALDDGDRIYAVVRGWAVNNDAGKKVGFTAPGVQGQAAVVAEALAAADLTPADIDYVEAHGTGTALGDAAELAALQQVFSGDSVLIGSVKTNVGHLDRAAGVTNLIKAAQALYREEIPPTRNLSDPNPQLSAGDAALEVVTELRSWPRRDDRPRRAGVSSFGIGGTNAHVVIEEAPRVERPAPSRRAELLVWSARSAAAAVAMTERLAAHLDGTTDRLPDIAHSLQTGRQVFGHRRILVAGPGAEPAAVAEAIRDGSTVSGRTESRTDRPVAFLIAGTGEQYPGLAEDLYATEPAFRTELDACRAVLRDELGGVDPVEDFLRQRKTGDGGGLGALLGRDEQSDSPLSTDLLHPALFAVEYSVARLLASWGIEPAMLAGYSLGEYVAACLAGVLPVESALALVAHRAKLINALPAGAMGAVPLPVDELRDRLALAGIDGVDVAALNGPELTVLAGPPDAVAAATEVLAADAVPCRPLATSHAFHSRMLEPVRTELTGWIAEHVPLAPPRVPYVSNVTGALITEEQATDPGYWAEHMCAPVRFDDVLATMLGQEDLALLEIGPGQSLGAMARGHRDCTPDRWPLVVPTLPAAADPRPAGTVLAEAVGRLWLAGVPVDWAGYQADRPVAKAGLPGYPFQRERYWIEPPGGRVSAPAAVPAEPVTEQAPRTGHVELMTPQWTADESSAQQVTVAECVLVAEAGYASDVAEALAEQLRAHGTDVRVAAETGSAGGDITVVDLRPLNYPSDVDDETAVLPLAAMLDALGGGDGNARVIVATRGGQAVSERESPVPAHTAAATLPLVANQEYLNLTCHAVDLDPAAGVSAAVEALAGEVRRPGGETLVAYRSGRRHVRGYTVSEPKPVSGGISQDGAYLITGGLGDVGLLMAEHLISSGARKILLTSRGGVPEQPGDPRYDAVCRLRELGAEVSTPAVDVTDESAMRELLATTGRLAGVIHAAAQTNPDTFRALRDLDADAVATHFGAKVRGARVLAAVLDELPAEQAPEFCVVFASTSAILGGITFGSYAAANAALAAHAHRNHLRHAAGETPTRWLAASWDTWACTLEKLGGGLGAAMAAHSMSTEEGLAALDRLLVDGRPDVVVAAGGLDDRLPRAEAEPVAGGPGGERFPRPELPQPYTPPLSQTERTLAELWSDVLGVEPVGTRDNFFDLGGNSLVALQMLALVKKRFGIAVPTVMLFEAPTVHTLAGILDEQGAGEQEPAQETARTTVTARQAPVSAESDVDRRIAIVGMAGRFPGADSVGEFWQNLRNGVESVSFFSEEELIASGVDPELIRDPSYVPARPVLDDVAGFDAAFFGISPRMAAITDPQQRAFLEVCWEALEQAGYAQPDHRGRVGVFGGANISTYLLRLGQALLTDDEQEVSHYEIIMGNDKDALTTTVSYLFDLYGPSVAVQTFCSTSLVAAHLAVQSLRAGECELALAGGVSIRVPDRIGHRYGPGGMESPDGHVRTFDKDARGSMFGDGAAVVVLKRLSDAVRDGDHIWSVIRGSAMNNDGALKVGYTAPSVVGQARVISDAMADAGVTGEDVSYIEAHGTATELGDPIEVAALTRAFGSTEENQYCPIGSVKTNVGHLDRAAGASGLIKTSFALAEQVIPPSLHFTAPNPEIDFASSPFYVNTALSEWRTRGGRPRIAGINSLGMGGTNVHMVVEEPPERAVTEPDGPTRRYQVLPISARNATAADQARLRLGEHLRDTQGIRLADVAYTLQVGRKTFEHRRVLVSDSVPAAAEELAAEQPADVMSRVDTVRGRQVAFLFAGVGEQYPGMVTELYRREPVFRAALDECLALLGDLLPDVDVADLVAGERGSGPDLAALLGRVSAGGNPRASTLERTEIVQPALFAVEYALASTLRAWGIRPRLMLGYSLGEYVAACLAGVLSLPDALALVTYRAKLISGVAAGSMVAVSMPVDELRRKVKLDKLGLDVAAVNGPQVTVVAGPADAVERFVEDLRRKEIPCRELRTTHAFHSRMLAPLADELTAWVAENVTLNPPRLQYLSNLTGESVDAELVCDPGYWAKHMCGTVQFASGVDTLLADPELAVLEIGPGQSLGALLRNAGCPPQRWPLVLHALPGGSDSTPDDAAFTGCLARMWLAGVDIDWTAYHGRRDDAADTATLPGRIPLPTYPFQRQRYWLDVPASVTAGPAAARLPSDLAEPADLFEAITNLPKLPEDRWLYLPAWRQTAEISAPEPSRQTGSWLVYTRDGTADDVVARLRRAVVPAGGTISVVRPGDAYAAAEDGYAIRPGNVADATALLRDLRAAGRQLEHVVHLWALGNGDHVDAREGLHTLVALARAAGESGVDSWTLDIAVSGTQQVLPGDVSNPDAAMLIGPSLVIPLEFPKVVTRLIDLDAAPTAAGVTALVGELCRPADDRTVALRHGRRWVPTYETMTIPSTVDNTALREGGVYLITGGLGGIALGLAEHLARDCRARLVLLGRSAPSGERAARVAALRELGAEVEVVTGDVSQPAAVRKAVDIALERFGALHGVLHAAGVPGMGLMQFKRPDELDAVLAPKVAGTLALADALRIGTPEEIELDFLVLFSSITSATGGGPGQVDYCAANAFLDAYAHQLADTGRRVIAVNWGEWTWNAWEEGLAGYDDKLQQFFRENRERVGIGFAEGWRCLLRALASGQQRVVVSTQDFPTVVSGSSRFNLEAVTSPTAAGDGGADRHPRPELVTPYQEPSGEQETKIAEIWSEALRLEQVGVLDNFFELGGNSLLGVTIVASLRKEFQLAELPPHILYEAPTVAALSKTIEALSSGAGQAEAKSEGSHVRAQLRRSGLEASAARRRGR